MPRLATIVLLLSGISGGYGAATAQLRLDVAAGPPGWRHESPLRPGQDAGLAGRAPAPTAGYPLGSHSALLAPPGGSGVEVVATLPDDGRLELRGTGTGRGAALVVNNLGDGGVLVLEAGNTDGARGPGPRLALECDGVLQGRALVGAGDARVHASLSTRAGGVVAAVDGESVFCTTQLASPRWSIRTGLRTLALARLGIVGTDAVVAPGQSPVPRVAGALAGLAAAALLSWLGRRFQAARALAPCTWPLLFAAPLAHADLGQFFTGARIVLPHPVQWAILGPLLASGVLLLWVGLGGWMRAGAGWTPFRAVASVAVGASAGGALAAALGPRDPTAAAFVAGIGAVVAVVTWANVRAVRGFNLLSLGGVALALLLAEHALSRTQWGASLVGVSNRGPGQGDPQSVSTIFDTFEALETTRAFTQYPDHDYPVRPPTRTAPTRIVALGSSSTAGAYQNDDLDEFWPAELQRMLGPGMEVVNQGVGGWTSLHVRRYLETQVDLVDPDVVVVYLGHNDILTPAPRSYADLLESWRRGDSAALATSSRLAKIRVYQALRFGLQALVPPPVQVAVPVDDARENYEAMARVLDPRGARMLLVREAISPNPAPLNEYGEMMASLAGDPVVAYLDASPVLADPRVEGAFLDPCHLTHHGHLLLAEAVAAALRAEGWLP